jgi:hypothetical protein
VEGVSGFGLLVPTNCEDNLSVFDPKEGLPRFLEIFFSSPLLPLLSSSSSNSSDEEMSSSLSL